MASPRARHLRKNSTNAEKHLWARLRRRQVDGCRFRRQVPIGPFVVDFACLEKKLLVEVDGGQHAIRQLEDNKRTAWLADRGYRVLRFWNSEVLRDTDAVLESIKASLSEASTPHPNPPPQGGRE